MLTIFETMASAPKRPLIKGSLRPLIKQNPQGGTHTEALSSKDEISVRRGNEKPITGEPWHSI